MKSVETPAAAVEHVGLAMPDLDVARRLFMDSLRLSITKVPGDDTGAFAVLAGLTTIRVTTTTIDFKTIRRTTEATGER